jgi:hypothetical protein
MAGAIPLHRPTGQQQSQDNTENHLFLLCQPIHGSKLAEKDAFGKPN